MTARATVVICTRDDELRKRLDGFLKSRSQTRNVESYDELLRLSDQVGPAVVLMDLRDRSCFDHLAEFSASGSQKVVIALGEPRSEPLIEAQTMGTYACESVRGERAHLQALVARALDFLRTAVENATLREEASRMTARKPIELPRAEPGVARPRWQLRHLSEAIRKLEKLDALFESTVENVAAAALVSRAGIFCRTRDSDVYRMRAGLRYLDETSRIEFEPRDPFVRWLAIHDHLVSRSTLEYVTVLGERHMLKQALDSMGAEIILPLYARGAVLGWLFIGHRATGIPFDTADLEGLTELADHISTVLENAFLYEEVAVQKTLAETLLHSMPTGIVAVGLNGIVRWFNSSAQAILDVSPNKVLNNPLRTLGSRLADVLQRTLNGDPTEKPQEWLDPVTRRHLSVQTHRLMNGDSCLGAVALVQDLTMAKLLEEKADQLERTAFWTELAASMSHEIRNPLVAIKTFAQLLPERYEDEEFRTDFSRHVTTEVDRLNSIIEQINHFAHPPEIKLRPVHLKDIADAGMKLARTRPHTHRVVVENWISDQMQTVLGDSNALAECFSHLITNSIEATAARTDGHVEIAARRMENGEMNNGVMVTVRDNGAGIPADALEKVFSPFYTTKARGMGLGLPIVKRTVIDHNGRVHVDSNSQGTTVSIVLPGPQQAESSEVKHEENIGRR